MPAPLYKRTAPCQTKKLSVSPKGFEPCFFKKNLYENVLISVNAFFLFLRRYPWGHHLLTLLPLAAVLYIVGRPFSSEQELAAYFMALRPTQPTFALVMTVVTHAAAPISYVFYARLFWTGLKRNDTYRIRLAIGYVVMQVLFSFLLVRLLKIGIGKPRPMSMLAGEGYAFFTLEHGNHSFPSGHTSEIIGTVTPVAAHVRRALFSLGAGVIIAVVGFSRIYLSMHHVADIAGGMLVGSLCAVLIHYYATRGQP